MDREEKIAATLARITVHMLGLILIGCALWPAMGWRVLLLLIGLCWAFSHSNS